MQMKELIDTAKCQLAEMTGLVPVTASGAFKDQDGWHIRVDMLEMRRIPNSTDLLGDYEVILAEDGTMLRLERKHTRLRGDSIDGNNG
ncbi:MAG: gas vesicle protein [Chloroflexi bacterium]|nr:gas vesicle protein [Chloroflexota bacterium]